MFTDMVGATKECPWILFEHAVDEQKAHAEREDVQVAPYILNVR